MGGKGYTGEKGIKYAAHLVYRYLPVTENWIYSMVSRMKRYHGVFLATRTENLDKFPWEPVVAVREKSLPYQVIEKLHKEWFGYFRLHLQAIEKYRVSLIHAHFGTRGYYGLPLARKSRLPYLVTFYGYDVSAVPGKRGWRERYRILFDEATLFLTEGPHLKNCLIELGCPEEKVVVHHLGVDPEKIPFKERKPEKTIRILMAGGFVEKKGIHLGIRAFDKLKERDTELWVVGWYRKDEPRHARGASLIFSAFKEAKKKDKIKFLGYLSYQEYMRVLEKCHILLAPSLTASDGDTEGGAPVVLLDAMASGMPVVSTLHADIPEVVVDGETGFLVPEKDVDALVEALERMVNNPSLWKKMGRKGRQRIEKEFNVNIQAERLERIYDRYA